MSMCRQTCGRVEENTTRSGDWIANAQHEVYTTIVGLSCLKDYHNLSRSNLVLMGNQVG